MDTKLYVAYRTDTRQYERNIELTDQQHANWQEILLKFPSVHLVLQRDEPPFVKEFEAGGAHWLNTV